ncbi:MAG: energy transducer TonB [Paludibacteraceae bacterium]|nr:energy transducer TonB [Paludibacteraceae bacterium]
MYKGKKTCETLKSIRKQIADANDIPYEPVVCTHKGDCMGTCPACESEMRYIENQLNIRKMAGKAVKIVGLATVMTLASCNSISTTDSYNPKLEVGDEMEGEIVDRRRMEVENLPEKPFVPVEDTVYAEGEDLFDEIVHAECPYDIVDFLINNLNYPIARLKSDTRVEIPVVVIFNVEDDGSISNVRVKDPVHPDFDKEAIRVVQKMEKWKPAMSNGRLVRSKFHVTIMFPNIPYPEPNYQSDSLVTTLGLVRCDVDSTSSKKEMGSKSESDDDDDDMIMVGMIADEHRAEFPGGDRVLLDFLKSNLVYPKAAQDSSIQGRVIVRFTVEKDGSITDVEVARGVHPALDEEAVRVVSMMPKWQPAMRKGDPIRSKFSLPIYFRLADEEKKKDIQTGSE